MANDLWKFIKNKMMQINILLIVIITVWWLFINPFDPTSLIDNKHIWSASYMFISIFGGIFGLIISKYWGGYKSLIGKAILCFSVGLFLQSFGQLVYNFHTLFLKTETPYPSLGDLGYFGSIPAYICGVFLLGRASGLKFSLRSIHKKFFVILLPIFMLIFSYMSFLKGYQFDWSSPFTIFLDFGYPLGQAVYVSMALALLILFISKNFLGGAMKRPIYLLLFALLVQYVCDFNFLYQANHGNWYAGSWGDYLYAISYFVMSMAIISIGSTFEKIKNS